MPKRKRAASLTSPSKASITADFKELVSGNHKRRARWTMGPPTGEPSRFERLPTEVLHIIVGYLLPSHSNGDWKTIDAKLARRQTAKDCGLPRPTPREEEQRYGQYEPGCSILDLSVTSKAMHKIVTGFCTAEFKRWMTYDNKRRGCKERKLRLPSKQDSKMQANPVARFIRRSKNFCVFCQEPFARTADMFDGFACCQFCDEREYPGKITWNQAKEEFNFTYCDYPTKYFLARRGHYRVGNKGTHVFWRTDIERLRRFNTVYSSLLERLEHAGDIVDVQGEFHGWERQTGLVTEVKNEEDEDGEAATVP